MGEPKIGANFIDGNSQPLAPVEGEKKGENSKVSGNFHNLSDSEVVSIELNNNETDEKNNDNNKVLLVAKSISDSVDDGVKNEHVNKLGDENSATFDYENSTKMVLKEASDNDSTEVEVTKIIVKKELNGSYTADIKIKVTFDDGLSKTYNLKQMNIQANSIDEAQDIAQAAMKNREGPVKSILAVGIAKIGVDDTTKVSYEESTNQMYLHDKFDIIKKTYQFKNLTDEISSYSGDKSKSMPKELMTAQKVLSSWESVVPNIIINNSLSANLDNIEVVEPLNQNEEVDLVNEEVEAAKQYIDNYINETFPKKDNSNDDGEKKVTSRNIIRLNISHKPSRTPAKLI